MGTARPSTWNLSRFRKNTSTVSIILRVAHATPSRHLLSSAYSAITAIGPYLFTVRGTTSQVVGRCFRRLGRLLSPRCLSHFVRAGEYKSRNCTAPKPLEKQNESPTDMLFLPPSPRLALLIRLSANGTGRPGRSQSRSFEALWLCAESWRGHRDGIESPARHAPRGAGLLPPRAERLGATTAPQLSRALVHPYTANSNHNPPQPVRLLARLQ
jgi:hypothetical protein